MYQCQGANWPGANGALQMIVHMIMCDRIQTALIQLSYFYIAKGELAYPCEACQLVTSEYHVYCPLCWELVTAFDW